MINIVYVGRNLEITQVMDKLLNANADWKGLCVSEDTEVIAICKKEPVDLILLGNGIDEASENDLRAQVGAINPNIKFIQHYGGGSGLLASEINFALRS